MKPILTYGLIFVIALSLSLFLHHFSASQDGSASLDQGIGFAKDDIQRLVAQEFAEQRNAAMLDDFGDQRLMLGPLQKELEDLQARQSEILKKIESLMNNDPLAGADPKDVKIPVDARLLDTVGSAIQRHEDKEQREREQRNEERRRERDAARRVELEKTLTEKLRLVGDQPARMMAVLDGIDEQRNKMFQDMRQARESGEAVNMDFNQMREQFTKMSEQIDADVKGILNPDQASLYEDYKKESPWTFGGAGMMRGGGRGRGGDASGNVLGGRNN